MGGLTSAIHWWEESQLRFLVLTSLAIQMLLLSFSFLRRMAVPGWIRSIMWLAYLGGDAVAIYALAALFNRHMPGEDGGGGSSSNALEVVWAPVLLLHLGGLDGITAYNLEDNELWSRQLLTAVSQITVAIYVFSKSWPSGADKRLWQAAILLFVPGVLRCLAKPAALKSASIHNLVSSDMAKQNEREIYTLEDYVKHAKAIVEEFAQEHKDEGHEAQLTSNSTVVEDRDRHEGRKEEDGKMTRKDRARRNYLVWKERSRKRREERGDVSKLFVDLSSSYPRWLCILKRLWRLSEETAYRTVRKGLATAFLLLYTRLKTAAPSIEQMADAEELEKGTAVWKYTCIAWIHMSRMVLPWAAIGLLHKSHTEVYSDIDARITYALFWCTAVLEVYSALPLILPEGDVAEDDSKIPLGWELWPQKVAQYSLIQFVARNKRHSKWIWIPSLLGCKDFLDQHWCMESCSSSPRITKLVLGYLKDGWKEKVQDVAGYLRFNDHSSHWVLEDNKQVSGLMRPFDECVLLWHIATDFCFFLSSFSQHKCAFAEGPIQRWMREEKENSRRRRMEAQSARGDGTSSFVEDDKNDPTTSQCSQELTKCRAVQCRQMSNYMVYLLFVNPEMLLPGSRRNLFTAAYGELKDTLLEDKKPRPYAAACKQVKDNFIKDNNRNVYRRVAAAFKEMKDINKDNKQIRQKQAALVKEELLMEKLISAMLDKANQACAEELKEEGPTEEPIEYKDNLIYDAWILAQMLLDNNKSDEMKMWKVIEKVWVEMLCFSSSRCRGYLHAKALGNGGEFLSYVWLLLFYMGMDTFTDRLRRKEQERESWGGNKGTAPAPPSASGVPADPSPSSTSESEVSTGTALPPLKVHNDMAQSTSEIHMAAEDMV